MTHFVVARCPGAWTGCGAGPALLAPVHGLALLAFLFSVPVSGAEKGCAISWFKSRLFGGNAATLAVLGMGVMG